MACGGLGCGKSANIIQSKQSKEGVTRKGGLTIFDPNGKAGTSRTKKSARI